MPQIVLLTHATSTQYTVHMLLLAHATTVIAFKLSYDTNVIIITVFGKNSIVAVLYVTNVIVF